MGLPYGQNGEAFMTRLSQSQGENTSGAKTGARRKGGNAPSWMETLVEKEMGREEGAQMGTCPQRQPLQTFCSSVAMVGA